MSEKCTLCAEVPEKAKKLDEVIQRHKHDNSCGLFS